MQNNILFLFTGEFPYGKKGEPFLNTEIWYLAKQYKHVFVFPRVKSDILRDLPSNVLVVDSLIGIKMSKKDLFFKLVLFLKCLKNEITSLSTLKKYLVNLKSFSYLFKEAIALERRISEFIVEKNIPNNEISAYTYWFDNSLLACSFLKEKKELTRLVSRIHGFDLYDERNISGIVPYRNTKTKQCNLIFAISKQGLNYFKIKINPEFHTKVKLSYLGAETPKFMLKDKKKENIPVVVSCARMESFKRIPQILESLTSINKEIKWVHFGDGSDFEKLKKEIENTKSKVKVELKGQVSNREILEYYNENHIDLFISASSSEGLPVSMMEVLSFGIPIVSFDVGGIAEIVIDNKTGFLCLDSDDFESFTRIINKALYEYSFNEIEIKQFFLNNFAAETNYQEFTNELINV